MTGGRSPSLPIGGKLCEVNIGKILRLISHQTCFLPLAVPTLHSFSTKPVSCHCQALETCLTKKSSLAPAGRPSDPSGETLRPQRGDPQTPAGRPSYPGGETLISGRGDSHIRAGRLSYPGGETLRPGRGGDPIPEPEPPYKPSPVNYYRTSPARLTVEVP